MQEYRSERRRALRLQWLASIRRELHSAQALAAARKPDDHCLTVQIDAALVEAELLEIRLKAGARARRKLGPF
jgi:hypothetical protein